MSKSILQNSFLDFCRKKKFEINSEQVKIVSLLDRFIHSKKNFLSILLNSKDKFCFYLHGNVGVGKTMILDFIYDKIKIKKLRLHFNEFMINFHDFRHEKESDNSINTFVINLKKKYELIYLDEFQVTNIVDAMILGKLFEVIFSENIKIIITTNTKLEDLYKDGLQRNQFLPFISTIKKYSIQKELLLKDDYRQQNLEQSKRIFYPLNEKTTFRINQNFRALTKGKKKEEKIIKIKGRNFEIKNYFNGVSRFTFKELCDAYLGAEDYINIAEISNHVFIESVPNFSDENSNQQQRFITLIDIFYDKKITLTLSLEKNIVNLASSNKHFETFKRTLSRLHEMTKIC